MGRRRDRLNARIEKQQDTRRKNGRRKAKETARRVERLARREKERAANAS